jgi:hypothetical protein
MLFTFYIFKIYANEVENNIFFASIINKSIIFDQKINKIYQAFNSKVF